MLYKIILTITVVAICTISPLHAEVITSLSLVEKNAVTTNNYPLTFGHVFKMGDVSSGVVVKYNGTVLTTQFDKKTSWADGSVKFGVVSVIIPQVVANGTGSLTIENAATNSTTGAMDKNGILATDVESNINLTNISGSGYSGSILSSLRDQLSNGDINYWLQGPVCTEVLETQQLNNSLDATWEARFYPGTSFGVRISNSVENVNILYRGNVVYDVAIQMGASSPSAVYAKEGFTHLHGSRWRKVFWLGAEPPQIELHYDINYLISTGSIPSYDSSLVVPESAMSSEYSAWLASSRDIGDNGLINKNFGATGGRRELGILPRWSVMYLLTMDNRMKDMMTKHGELAGHVMRSHWRETDSSKSNFGGVVTIDDRSTYDLADDWGGGIPTAIGSMDKGGWTIDRAHHGSYSYLPYLITGDYWFLRETMFWGAYALAYDNYGREGGTAYGQSYGCIYDQVRGQAWSLRSISDAAFVVPDSLTIEKKYFASKLNNNLSWYYDHNQLGSHGVHAFRGVREYDDFPVSGYPWHVSIAPWMHDFVVIAIRHIVDQKTGTDGRAEYLLNYLGYFTKGRFGNHPTFNKWDGAGYYFPLQVKGGGAYYNEGDWATYWANVLDMHLTWESNSQGMPNSTYTRYDYADSYLAIAAAALACIPGADNEFTFARNNLTTVNLAVNPTWGFTPIKHATGTHFGPGGNILIIPAATGGANIVKVQ